MFMTLRYSRRHLLRTLSLGAAGVTGATLLAACGGTTTTTTTATVTQTVTKASVSTATVAKTVVKATTQTVTASVASSQSPTSNKGEVSWLVRTSLPENKWEREVVEPGFAKAHPDIHLNVITVPWAQFDPKLFTLFAAGTPIDIWSHWGQSGFADYRHKGMVADLTPYINADHYDLSAFAPGLTEIYKFQGRYYGLPADDGAAGSPLIYNKSLLEKAGITPPGQDWTNPWTWDQMVEAAKKMTTNYGAPTATYGMSMTTDLQLLARLGGIDLYTWSITENGGIAKPGDYHADAPEVLTAVQAVYDLIYKEKVMPSPQLGSALGAAGSGPFRAGKLGMNWNGGWLFETYKPVVHSFTWAPAADPKLKTNSTTLYTDPWMLSSKSKAPEAAWTFMQYLLSYPVQNSFQEIAGIGVTNTKAIDNWIKGMEAPTGLTATQLKQELTGAYKVGKESYNHLLVNYDQLITAENQAMSNIWNGKTSPADGLKQAKAAVDAVLAKMG